jgi:subfamily B ATP-binding cassette protein MsbA
MRSVAVQAISSPLMDALGAVLLALLLWFGRNFFIMHGVTLRATFIVVHRGGDSCLYDPVRKLPGYYNNFQQARAPASTSSASWTRRTTWSRRSGRWC